MPLMIDELWAIVSKEWDNREISPDVRKNAYNIGIDQALPIPGESKNTKSQIMMIHCHSKIPKIFYVFLRFILLTVCLLCIFTKYY